MPSTSRLARTIIAGRRQKRLTPEELAAKMRVSTRSVEMWEVGLHIPTPAKLERLALALSLDYEELKAQRFDEIERRRDRRHRERRARKEDAAGAAA